MSYIFPFTFQSRVWTNQGAHTALLPEYPIFHLALLMMERKDMKDVECLKRTTKKKITRTLTAN